MPLSCGRSCRPRERRRAGWLLPAALASGCCRAAPSLGQTLVSPAELTCRADLGAHLGPTACLPLLASRRSAADGLVPVPPAPAATPAAHTRCAHPRPAPPAAAPQMDWSWSSPAQDYLELYYRALKK